MNLPTVNTATTFYPLPIIEFGVKNKCCKKYKKKGKHCKRCPRKATKKLTSVKVYN